MPFDREEEQELKKKYIKDYVATPNGELEYRGKYFRSQISKEECKIEGKIQVIYGIACVILLLVALCIPCRGNETIYVVIPLELSLICLWAYITGSLAFLKCSNRMQEKDYDKAYQGPIQALTVSIFLYIFSFGGQVIGILMNSAKEGRGDFYFTLVLFFILLMSVVVWNRQRKIMHLVTEEK